MSVSYPMLMRGSRGDVQWTLLESPDGMNPKPFNQKTGPFRYEIGFLLQGRLRSVLTIHDKTRAVTAFARLSDIDHGWFASDEQVYVRLRANAANMGGTLEDQ
jgi:hypothetical protein